MKLLKTEHEVFLSILNDQLAYSSRTSLQRWRDLSDTELRNSIEQTLDYLSKTREAPVLSSIPLSVDPAIVSLLSKYYDKYLRIIGDYIQKDIGILTLWDKVYPQPLHDIPNAPLILYYLGKVFPGAHPIAIVGTREPSENGIHSAYYFSQYLAKEGHTIVSGLAKGIDTAAHKGALNSGTTIAVLGGDLIHIYPEENTQLAEEIILKGSLVSEVTNHVDLHKGRFIERNRITSGLSEAVLVIESSGQGGTIRQVEFAIKQKRPVFVLYQDKFKTERLEDGFNKVVKMGAIPVSYPDEIIERLNRHRGNGQLFPQGNDSASSTYE